MFSGASNLAQLGMNQKNSLSHLRNNLRLVSEGDGLTTYHIACTARDFQKIEPCNVPEIIDSISEHLLFFEFGCDFCFVKVY